MTIAAGDGTVQEQLRETCMLQLTGCNMIQHNATLLESRYSHVTWNR